LFLIEKHGSMPAPKAKKQKEKNIDTQTEGMIKDMG
jgi:hypothetical protein